MTRAVDIDGRGVRVNGRSVEVGSAIPYSAIYYEGDEVTSKTGGWVVTQDGGNGTVTFNSDNIYFETPSSNGEKHHAGTSDTVDASPNTLRIEHSSNDFPGFECGIGLDANSSTIRSRNCSTYFNLTTSYSSGSSFSRTTDSFDISNLSGSLYVRTGIDGSVSFNGGQWTVHAIYIE